LIFFSLLTGKILADDQKLSEYNIDPEKFIVVMVTNPKVASPEPKPSTHTNETNKLSTSSVTHSNTASQSAAATGQVDKSKESEVKSEQNVSNNAPLIESSMVVGDDLNRVVDQLSDMGYPRSEVERALELSYNNPERAVEYLVNGLPPVSMSDGLSSQSAVNSPSSPAIVPPISNSNVNANINANDSANPLEFLRNEPQFQQMRQFVQSNPQMISTVIQQIGASNPALLEIINQNQEQFLQMLNERPTSGQPARGGGGNVAPGDAPLQGDDDLQNINMSSQDRAAIERVS